MNIYHHLQSREMQKEGNMKWAQRTLASYFIQIFRTYIYSKKKFLQHKPHTYTQLPPTKYLCKPLGCYPQLENHCVGYGTKKKKRGNGRAQSLQYPGNIPERLLLKWSIVSYLCLPITLTSPSLTSWFLQTTNTSSVHQHCARQAKIQRMKKTKNADFLFDFSSITSLRHIKFTPNCTSTLSPNLIFFNFLY